ncbi:molecular chaperone [Alteromonas facilis]|uniref:fimbrial biogenesis chaperone n=1 Tax=Alteromonas facilis TaxID=2048004 RepID=UPI000C28C064|nr:Fn3-like domain-containing protein [Alteromonas facilis]
MLKTRIISALLLTFMLLAPQIASANLLIYPVRISFDENERTEQITLTNTSDKTNTYRLQWNENRALPEGGYQLLTEQEAKAQSLPIASDMIRFAPRQVTLKPGERQVIKLSLRRPRDLTDGEYRSHLLLKAIPPEKNAVEEGVAINMVMSFAVPISVQQGVYDTKVSLEKAAIELSQSTGAANVKLGIKREGLHSPSGDIEAYWTPDGGQEVLLGKIADFSVWTEIDYLEAKLVWTQEKVTPSNGTLRVVYEGVRDFDGIEYINETVRLKSSDFIATE